MTLRFAAAIWLLATGGAFASVAYAPNAPVIIPVPYVIDTNISQGQSWEDNTFDSFASPYNIPNFPTLLIAPHYTNPVTTSVNGPLPQSAGINIPGTIDGFTYNRATDPFTIGLVGMSAQQLWRTRDSTPTLPILQFNAAYPASTWTSGLGGGLAPGATFTGSVTNNLLTVASGLSGVVVTGQIFAATGAPTTNPYHVVDYGTGTGGLGNYTIQIVQTVISTTFTMTHSTVVASIGGAAPSDVMTVSSVVSGTVTATDAVPAPALTGTTLLAFGGSCDGNPCTGSGGAGTYALQVGTALTLGSAAMATNGVSWSHQATILTALQTTAVPRGQISGVTFSSVDYTQGGATDNTEASKVSDLSAMLTDYDALNLPGVGTTGMNYYLQLPSAVSNATVFPVTNYGTVAFAVTNAPGAGGTWSGRAFLTAPSYAWPFKGTDNIHTGAYGTARWGEWLGYIRHQVQDLGNKSWTPLWRTLNTTPTVSTVAQTVTLAYTRPNSTDFASGVLAWQSLPNDGIKVWPQYGFDLKVNGVDVPVTPTISGMNIVLTAAPGSWTSGASLEVSYGWYGPGGPSPGNNSGVGGNLQMQGPASVLFAGEYLNAWAIQSDETVVAP